MSDATRPWISPLSLQEAAYAEQLLRGCRPRQLTGLVDLMRFGLASTESASGPFVVAAWLLNASRHEHLPRHDAYLRPDGSGFRQCDPEWLMWRVKEPKDASSCLLACLETAQARPAIQTFTSKDEKALLQHLARSLEVRAPTVILAREQLLLLLAMNEERGQVFVCEVETEKARLRWRSVKKLWESLPAVTCYTLPRATHGPAFEADRENHGREVVSLDSEKGLEWLVQCEGLNVVAYSALHGNTQRDLSSCQVASLSSVMLGKGERRRITGKAQAMLENTSHASESPQSVLRSLAITTLKERRGLDFKFRGLSLLELQQLAEDIGLKAQAFELSSSGEPEQQAFRETARAALGRTIVNFLRGTLGQLGAGHHSVVVAYHPLADVFLVDDPAGFKMPAFWVSTQMLVKAMATFDDTPGVKRHRGYLVIEGDARPSEFSMSVYVQRPK